VLVKTLLPRNQTNRNPKNKPRNQIGNSQSNKYNNHHGNSGTSKVSPLGNKDQRHRSHSNLNLPAPSVAYKLVSSSKAPTLHYPFPQEKAK
jgi:hypothetical protein